MSHSMIIKGIIGAIVFGIVILAFMLFRTKRKEIILLVFSSVMAIILCEFFVRRFLPQITEYNHMLMYDLELGWKYVPNAKGQMIHPGTRPNTIQMNSLGFRDSAPSMDKKKKLLVMGDSFVSNIAVKDKDVFTEIMEDYLKEVDVLNFGVVGYGQVQEYLLLKKWIDVVRPDAIILVIYLQNDFGDNVGDSWLYSRPYATLERGDSVLTIRRQSADHLTQHENQNNLLSNSHLNILLTRTINRLFSDPDSLYIATELQSCRLPISEHFNISFKVMEKLLLKINGLAKERNIPLVFALAPSLLQVQDDQWELFLEKNKSMQHQYHRSLPNDRLMQFSKKNNILMVDLFPLLHQKSREQIKLYHPLEQHWTKEGNQAVAESLMDYLNANSLIP